METNELQAIVRQFAPSPKAIWPNGLGYNWRGWEYNYSGLRNAWVAIRGSHPIYRIGYGISPDAAKDNAKIVDAYDDVPSYERPKRRLWA